MARVALLVAIALAAQSCIAERAVLELDDEDDNPGGEIDPLDLLGGSTVDTQLHATGPGGQRETQENREIIAELNAEELVERDAERQQDERHELNCHKFGDDPVFRQRLMQTSTAQERRGGLSAENPHVVAQDIEMYDEPSVDSSRNAAYQRIGADQMGDPMVNAMQSQGTAELDHCVFLSWTHRAIQTKAYTNPTTGRKEELDLPHSLQTLGAFDIDAIFHDKGSLPEGEFYVVFFEAVDPAQGLAKCNLLGQVDKGEVGMDGKTAPHYFRKTWVIYGEGFEEDIEKTAEKIAEHLMAHAEGTNEELKQLAEHIKKQEKKIPFNHKMETSKITFKKCTHPGKDSGALQCSATQVEYLHDRAFTYSSEEVPTFDYVKLSQNANQDHALNSKPGFTFKDGTDGKLAELKGAIDWHTTVSAGNRCMPAMKQWFYVAVGTDSHVDLDLGVIMYVKQGGKYKRELVNFRNGERIGSKGRHYKNAMEYSGDNRAGAGVGGDAEWMFFDLSMLKLLGVEMIAIMVHNYDGVPGSFSDLRGTFARFVMGDASSEKGSEQALKWSAAQTVDYVDIDEIRSDGPPAALVGMLWLEPKSDLVLPQESVDSMKSSHEKVGSRTIEYPGSDGVHYNLAIKKHVSTCGRGDCDVGDSACDIEKNVLKMSYGGGFWGGAGCPQGDGKDVKEPKPVEESKDKRQKSLNVVESGELEQPRGEVLDPLDLLGPEPDPGRQQAMQRDPNGGFQNTNGQHLSAQDVMDASVDKTTATQSNDDFLKEMLVEFPGGVPGTDTLCTSSGSGGFW